MAKWLDAFVAAHKANNDGKEPSKKDISLATPIFVVATTNPKKKNTQS